MAECYSGLYEEGEVEHINGFPPALTIHSNIIIDMQDFTVGVV